VGLAVEFGFAVNRGHQVNEGYLVTGMLIPLIMPIDVPLWMLAISVIFAVVIGKEVFGGTGMNILNPALTARAFLFFAYPTKMSGDKVWVHNGYTDAISGETALGQLATMTNIDISKTDFLMSPFANDGVFSLSNAFLGVIPGSVGETSVIAILIGAFILLFTGVGSRLIMFSMVLGGLLMAYVFNILGLETNLFMSLPPLHQLCLGGFLFGTVFMATDPVSATQTNTGKIIYGFLCGILSILIRVVNPAYPEGIMVAILFMNVMAPLIDHYVVQASINRRLKRIKS
jgi:Na+-transporting NADH:ubiquinone oxidoreductase subunit B